MVIQKFDIKGFINSEYSENVELKEEFHSLLNERFKSVDGKCVVFKYSDNTHFYVKVYEIFYNEEPKHTLYNGEKMMYDPNTKIYWYVPVNKGGLYAYITEEYKIIDNTVYDDLKSLYNKLVDKCLTLMF
jgi:hypothetical protein